MKPIAVVVGTRPEIIKMAPIIRALKTEKLHFSFVHCGQHYDYNMSQQFIEDLGLETPNYSLKIEASSPGTQTAEMIMKIDQLFGKIQPSIVLVEGDTNTVLSASIAANKKTIPIGHVEAGLRSFDLRMPEEHNRRLTDHISEYLFTPTERAKANLIRENVWGKIFLTGNTVIDSVIQHLPIAKKKSTIMEKIPFKKFALITAHRAENVDDVIFLESLIDVFSKSPLPIIYPMHPRTRKRLQESNMISRIEKMKNVLLLSPLGYFDFLVLMKNCSLILTDSGGVQEEATSPGIRKKVLIIRLSTEREEAVEAGFAKIVGTDKDNILDTMRDEIERNEKLPSISPFGNGKAAIKIVNIIKENIA